MNANSLLSKLTKMQKVVKDEEHNRNEAIDILDANVASLKKEYNSVLIAYIKEAKLLKHVSWRLSFETITDTIYLFEDGWTLDIKEELHDFIDDEYTSAIDLLCDARNDSFVRLWLPDEPPAPPYIEVKEVKYLTTFLSEYELEVDLTQLQKVIDTKATELATLEKIKQSVPN